MLIKQTPLLSEQDRLFLHRLIDSIGALDMESLKGKRLLSIALPSGNYILLAGDICQKITSMKTEPNGVYELSLISLVEKEK